MRAWGTGLILAGLLAACTTALTPAAAEPVAVTSAPIPLYPSNPGEKRAGVLLYRGGLLLSSNERNFGGLSDLAVTADGSEMLAISDNGRWLSARLTYDEAGNLAVRHSTRTVRNRCPPIRRFGICPMS